MKNVSRKSCTENQNTYLTFNNFFPENRAVYGVMWKNTVEPDRPQMAIQYGACALRAGWLQTHTHSEYVTLIAFPRQQWLCERASMLRYTYITGLVGYWGTLIEYTDNVPSSGKTLGAGQNILCGEKDKPMNDP